MRCYFDRVLDEMSKSPSKDTTLETRKTLAVKVCLWFQMYILCAYSLACTQIQGSVPCPSIVQPFHFLSCLSHFIFSDIFRETIWLYAIFKNFSWWQYMRPFFRHLTTLLTMMPLSLTTSDVSMELEHLSWVWDMEWIRIRNQRRSQPTSQSFH